MKAFEIMEELFSWARHKEIPDTCDTCKAGNPEQEVQKVAVSMFATPEVVRRASEWGAQLLVVHEPTYYNHMDIHSDEALEVEKRKFLADSGLTIYRYHDHPHDAFPDLIAAGEVRALGLEGEVEYRNQFDLTRLHLKQPITPRQLAKRMEERMGLKHVRIAGAADVPCTEISGMFGTPGGVAEELRSEQCQILLTGEACEWALGEYARDAAQLGHRKALIVMSHIGSERDGMRFVADRMTQAFPELEIRYFECGEVYTYSDDV